MVTKSHSSGEKWSGERLGGLARTERRMPQKPSLVGTGVWPVASVMMLRPKDQMSLLYE